MRCCKTRQTSEQVISSVDGDVPKSLRAQEASRCREIQVSLMQQAAMELVAEYTAEFHKLAAHYKFGEHLQEALRDRLVCGLKSEFHH